MDKVYVFEGKTSTEAIEKCLSLFSRGKADEIEEILKIFKEKGIKQETIENCLSICLSARGKTDEKRSISSRRPCA